MKNVLSFSSFYYFYTFAFTRLHLPFPFRLTTMCFCVRVKTWVGQPLEGCQIFSFFFIWAECLLVLLRHRFFSESGGWSLIQKAFTAFTHTACKSLCTHGPTSQRRGSEGRSSSGVTLAAEWDPGFNARLCADRQQPSALRWRLFCNGIGKV